MDYKPTVTAQVADGKLSATIATSDNPPREGKLELNNEFKNMVIKTVLLTDGKLSV